MVGILGKAFLDLEPYIDIQPLLDLHERIAYGLALCEPPRTETGSFQWKDEARVDVWTKLNQIRASGNSQHIQALERLFQAGGQTYHKAYLYTQLIAGGYTGSRTLLLKYNVGGYYHKNIAEGSIWTESAKEFPELLAFIETLPFTEIGQIAIYMTENDCVVPVHRDIKEQKQERMNEFLWFSPQRHKKIFILDENTGERHVCTSRVLMFNELDYHGVEALPFLTYSLRVDGKFTPEFRRKIGLA